MRWLNRLASIQDVPISINARDMKGGGPEIIANKAVRVLLRVAGGPAMYQTRYLFLDESGAVGVQQQVARAREIAKRNSFSMIWQPICHECFLLKHFLETVDRNPPSENECEAALLGVWPAYRKGMDATEYEKQMSAEHLVRARTKLADLDAFLKDINWN
ncbi:MAG: hypothetical protein OXI75_02810 [Rhodospirillales bacterium]|nr:hypothetical protein [Rhodospirillales bacterium]